MTNERRKAHLAGISPGTMLALCIAASSIIGTWFVMQDDIQDNKDAIQKQEDVNRIQWQRLSEHKH